MSRRISSTDFINNILIWYLSQILLVNCDQIFTFCFEHSNSTDVCLIIILEVIPAGIFLFVPNFKLRTYRSICEVIF